MKKCWILCTISESIESIIWSFFFNLLINMTYINDFFMLNHSWFFQISPANFLKNYILLIMISQLSHFPLFIPLHPTRPSPPLISCLWVVHISSLASTFRILFLTSPCLFCTYYLCFLSPVPFPSFSPLHLPADNPPCDLHFCDSVPVLVVCFVFVFFRLGHW